MKPKDEYWIEKTRVWGGFLWRIIQTNGDVVLTTRFVDDPKTTKRINAFAKAHGLRIRRTK